MDDGYSEVCLLFRNASASPLHSFIPYAQLLRRAAQSKRGSLAERERLMAIRRMVAAAMVIQLAVRRLRMRTNESINVLQCPLMFLICKTYVRFLFRRRQQRAKASRVQRARQSQELMRPLRLTTPLSSPTDRYVPVGFPCYRPTLPPFLRFPNAHEPRSLQRGGTRSQR